MRLKNNYCAPLCLLFLNHHCSNHPAYSQKLNQLPTCLQKQIYFLGSKYKIPNQKDFTFLFSLLAQV
jgi:hypothetical protein